MDKRFLRLGHGFEHAALGVLAAATIAAVAGYAVFGVHPELLRGQPAAQRVYAIAFTLFARGQIVVAAAALAILLMRRVGWAWLPAAVVVYVVSLASELAGTTIGLPFGAYAYTDGLGAKWFAHVPVLIPVSWFMMAVPSFAIAARIAGTRPLPRIACASLVLVSWDLALDPAMSYATKYWVWGATGAYYGMPWLNLVGWYVTGVALMVVLSILRADRWIDALPLRWLAAFFLSNVVLAIGLCAASGLALAVLAGLVPLAFGALALRPARPIAPARPLVAEAR